MMGQRSAIEIEDVTRSEMTASESAAFEARWWLGALAGDVVGGVLRGFGMGIGFASAVLAVRAIWGV